jgi:hypothetical protein
LIPMGLYSRIVGSKDDKPEALKNYALIRLPSVTFPSDKVQGQTIFRGIDEFTNATSERIRRRLLEAGVECTLTKRIFKPAGTVFSASIASGQYFVHVSVEPEALPEAQITISAEPRRHDSRSWVSFEPLFRRAIESEFEGCCPRWVTVDEYVGDVRSV